jgi:hypothetical protein
MAKSGGSLPRGRRTRSEVPPVPVSELSPVQAHAQGLLQRMVEDAGGRFSQERVGIAHIDALCDLFDEWAATHGERVGGAIRFSGRPGLWHALDQLFPLQDPNRWDLLRKAVIERLEASGWQRLAPPRGSSFEIPDKHE